MKVTIRHPALVRAKTKGGRIARPSVILPEAEFTVHDLDHRQAPVAFIGTTRGNLVLQGGEEARARCDSTYCLIMSRGAPPHDAAK